jgi:hypothetical protein
MQSIDHKDYWALPLDKRYNLEDDFYNDFNRETKMYMFRSVIVGKILILIFAIL